MSVPKSRRKQSRFEAQHHFYKLRQEVTALILNDFGFREDKYLEALARYRELHADALDTDGIVERWAAKNESFRRWFIDSEAQAILEILRNIERSFTMGNSIFPSETPARLFEFVERRRLRAYKRMVDSGRIPYDDVEQAVKSWMGEYSRIMSKKQICHIKQLYAELFGKELSWKK